MSEIAITFVITGAALGLMIWGRIPPVIVALCVSLAVYLTGLLPAREALAGFGEPAVLFVASLFVVAAGLEMSGVMAWAAQFIAERAGTSPTRLLIFLMLIGAVACATIGKNGAMVALLPVALSVATRQKIPASQLLLPMSFATQSAVMLILLGSPVNVLASYAAAKAGYGQIGFFEFAVAGVPLLVGTMAIILATRTALLPRVNGATIPADLSTHAYTLVEQYRIADGLHRLVVRSTSPYVGRERDEVDLNEFPALSLVAVENGKGMPVWHTVHEGDVLLIRGDAAAAGQLAVDKHLAFHSSESAPVAETLCNRSSGLAEVVIPPRSKLIGQVLFPYMMDPSGNLMVLAVQRCGENLELPGATLAAGDHLLLQGTWHALETCLGDPQVLVVDSPELIRRQAIPLGLRATEAIGTLTMLVILLATGLLPPAIAALSCAVAMVLLRVVTVPQAYKSVDWNTCLLIAGMMPLAAAMIETGASQWLADALLRTLGGDSPRALLAGLFLVSVTFTSFLSNTVTAILMFPIAIATASQTGLSVMPFLIGVAIGSNASLLTPVATAVNLLLVTPGGYKFTDYTKFGLPIVVWWLIVVLFIVPRYWPF